MSELWATLNAGLTDDELCTVLRKITAHLRSGSEWLDDFLVEAEGKLHAVLREDHDPLVWLQACVILAQICNVSSAARNELARCGMLSRLAKVLNESVTSLASVDPSSRGHLYEDLTSLPSVTPSSDRGHLYEELVRFVMKMLDHFARGSSLCIRKFLQYHVLYAVLSVVDYNTSALYVSEASGMF